MAFTQQSGPWEKLMHEKKFKPKILCPCTFKLLFEKEKNIKPNANSNNMIYIKGYCN